MTTSDPNSLRGRFYDVRNIDVRLERLDPDTEDSCPVPMSEILEHVEIEAPGESGSSVSGTVGPLRFARTARIGETRFWMWTFQNGRGEPSYAHVEAWPDGTTIIDCDDTFNMTIDQYLMASYFRLEP
jgi:hypothetical protein